MRRPKLWVLLGLATCVGFRLCAADVQFVVIGDTRPRFESESFRPFETLIARMNEQQPALIINLGDLIYGYGVPGKEKQWDKYEAVIKQIAPPYYQLPGNHDTHSRSARRIYGRRFGRFYQSFDYRDCHFVLLDNTERQRWGYLGPEQLEWVRRDLQTTQARSVFVFMHFPIWEPERITPQYYAFWQETLHPLFKVSRVKAVFAGHYHTYGPTREFDGIHYFITGGGGAELIPEYRKSGGQYHFMKVRVAESKVDVRVVTDKGELSDPEADIMGGLTFGARHVSRIGITGNTEELKRGVEFKVSVSNPHGEMMTGEATWLVDASAFSVTPATIPVQIPPDGVREYRFTLKALNQTAVLDSLPRLQFRLKAGSRLIRFHREVRLVQEAATRFVAQGPKIDGKLEDWADRTWTPLGRGRNWEAKLASSSDGQKLHLAVVVPRVDNAETEELGFSDELQLGFARAADRNDFGTSLLRIGFRTGSRNAWDRTAGHSGQALPGIQMSSREQGEQKIFEIAMPLRLLRHAKGAAGNVLLVDVSYPVPEEEPEGEEQANPPANTLSYRVRYGSDSLVPVSFVALHLGSPPPGVRD